MRVTWRLDHSVKGGAVHDGDSFHIVAQFVDVGLDETPGYDNFFFTIETREMVRLAHCNAPELSTLAGVSIRNAVVAWFTTYGDGPIPLVPYGRDKYRRLLADVVPATGQRLSDYVLALPGVVPMNLKYQTI